MKNDGKQTIRYNVEQASVAGKNGGKPIITISYIG